MALVVLFSRTNAKTQFVEFALWGLDYISIIVYPPKASDESAVQSKASRRGVQQHEQQNKVPQLSC